MSEQKPDIFKDIFQKEILEYREPVEEENWDLVAARLERKHFYKFSFAHFNIYYALILITTFLLSAFSFVVWLNNIYSFYDFTKANDKNQTSIQRQDSLDIHKKSEPSDSFIIQKGHDTIVLSAPNHSGENTSFNKTVLKNKKEPASTASLKDSLTVAIPLTPKKDTMAPLPKKEEPKNRTIKKTIYVVKQDTLIRIDTVRKSKRNKK